MSNKLPANSPKYTKFNLELLVFSVSSLQVTSCDGGLLLLVTHETIVSVVRPPVYSIGFPSLLMLQQ